MTWGYGKAAPSFFPSSEGNGFLNLVQLVPCSCVTSCHVLFPQDVTWRFLTTRSSRLCWRSQWIRASKPCTSWPGCARFGWASSRDGEQNTGGRRWPALPAGSSCISTGPCSGWTRSWRKWAPRVFVVPASPKETAPGAGGGNRDSGKWNWLNP